MFKFLLGAFDTPSLLVGGVVACMVCGVVWYVPRVLLKNWKKVVVTGVIVAVVALVKLAFL